jgi:hypothetical protein
MSGLYSQFKTDDRLETEGIWLQYDDTRVRVSRAGGGNKKFQKRMEALSRPHRRAIQADLLSNDMATGLVLEAFLDTVILDWQVRDKASAPWKSGIPGPKGEVLPFSKENARKVLTDLPDLFEDIRDQASKAVFFRDEALQVEAGN